MQPAKPSAAKKAAEAPAAAAGALAGGNDAEGVAAAVWGMQSVARRALRVQANDGAGEVYTAARYLVVNAPASPEGGAGVEATGSVAGGAASRAAAPGGVTSNRGGGVASSEDDSSSPDAMPNNVLIRGEAARVYARYASPLERCKWLALPTARVPLYIPQVRLVVGGERGSGVA